MNDPVFLNLLAVAIAFGAAWLWIRRRYPRRPVSSANASALPSSPRLTDTHIANQEHRAAEHEWQPLDAKLFGLSLVVFAATRLIGLENFPIYFFTDEAANTVMAADFVRSGFRDSSGQFFPIYFENNEKLSLSVSVYMQVIPTVLFGASVFVTRATSALIALSGMIAVGLILRDIFKSRFAWAGVLLLAITPAWFLHSRTAFETTLHVSFYAWFLYFYLRYRDGQPRHLLTAVLFGALAFYAYNTGQPGAVLTGLLLVLSDARYHSLGSQNRRAVVAGLVLAVVLALPYLRFQAEHPAEVTQRLQQLDSYWLQRDLTLAEKLDRFWREYSYGLSPAYWYVPDNPRDLIRHQMKGYGNILWVTLPLTLAGALACLKNIRSSPHRAVLIAAVTAPIGAALVEVHVTRALVFVVPAALLASIGLSAILVRLTDRLAYNRLAIGLFALLCVVSLAMLGDALRQGPTWYANYGLAGLQYGAKEVFGEVKAHLKRSPQTQVWVFPTWLNGSDVLRRFFVPDDPRVYLVDIDGFLADRFDLTEDVLLVLAREEYARIIDSRKFSDVRIERTLDLPDGTPGFYFVRMKYSPEANAIFAAERVARRLLVQEEIVLDGQAVATQHTRFDIGRIQDLFDGDVDTLARTQAANPAVIELTFPEPLRLTGLALTTGSMDFSLTIRLFGDGDTQPGRYSDTYMGLPPDPTLDLIFDPEPGPVRKVWIEIKDIRAGDAARIHIREIALRR